MRGTSKMFAIFILSLMVNHATTASANPVNGTTNDSGTVGDPSEDPTGAPRDWCCFILEGKKRTWCAQVRTSTAADARKKCEELLEKEGNDSAFQVEGKACNYRVCPSKAAEPNPEELNHH